MSGAPENPYAPPSAVLVSSPAPEGAVAFTAAVMATPQLLALIVLAQFPLNAAIGYHVATLEPDDVIGALRASVLPAAIMHPLFIGITLEAARRLERGEAVSMGALVSGGFSAWGRVFATGFVVNLVTMLGFVALVVPGIWLALRYSLAEVAAFGEKSQAGAAMRRSIVLTQGRFWQIAVVHAALLVAIVLLFALGAVSDWVPAVGHPLVGAATTTLFDAVDLARFAALWAIYRAALPSEPSGAAALASTEGVSP